MAPPYRLDTSRISPQLLPIDKAILWQLCEGRCTTGYIAEEIGEQQPYVSRRLNEQLVERGYVRFIHRGLYELAPEYRVELPDEYKREVPANE